MVPAAGAGAYPAGTAPASGAATVGARNTNLATINVSGTAQPHVPGFANVTTITTPKITPTGPVPAMAGLQQTVAAPAGVVAAPAGAMAAAGAGKNQRRRPTVAQARLAAVKHKASLAAEAAKKQAKANKKGKNGKNGKGMDVKPTAAQLQGAEDLMRKKSLIKQQRQRLWLLNHSAHCSAPPGQCQSGQGACDTMKQLMPHLKACTDTRCTVRHCVSSRFLWHHFRGCKDQRCQVCVPVRRHFADARARAAQVQAEAVRAHQQQALQRAQARADAAAAGGGGDRKRNTSRKRSEADNDIELASGEPAVKRQRRTMADYSHRAPDLSKVP